MAYRKALETGPFACAGDVVRTCQELVELRSLPHVLPRWEKGVRAPQGGDAARLRSWLGKAMPHRNQLDKLMKLAGASATVRAPLVSSDPEVLTVSGAAAYSGITEKTIRKALKDGRLAYTQRAATQAT